MQVVEAQKKEYQEEREAFDAFFATKDQVEKTFFNTRDIVRELSKNDHDLQNRLKFSPMGRLSHGDWIQTGVELYESILRETAFLERLARFNLTVDRLHREKQELVTLRDLRNRTLVEEGEAQEATRLRNQKLEELDDYCSLLKTIAAIALQDRPQLMETLGVMVRS
jgi:sulfur relay (sulfurtransferase) DsrF/TusC family protein